MIEFFTILFIEYASPEYDMAPTASVIYATEEHCQEVLDKGFADPIYDHLMKLYGNDIMMYCHVTDEVSKLVRPKLRPNNLQGGD